MPVNIHRKIGEILASLAACLGFLVLPVLPRRAVVRLADGMGRLGARVFRRMRRVATANLDMVYGETLSRAEKDGIIRQSFTAFALLLLDYFWFAFWTRRRLEKYVRFDESFQPCFSMRPAIAVSAHFGNWEVLGNAAALRGNPYISIARPVRNRFLHALLVLLRGRGGQQIVWKRGAVRSLLRILKEGGRTALLMDQNTVPRDGGVYVKFFGLPVPISKIVHMLASRSGAKIVFLYCMADRNGYYTASALPAFTTEPPFDSAEAATQRVAELTESVIRRYPGQWLWMYRRWRYIPSGVSGAGYPYYAKPLPRAFLGKDEESSSGRTGC